MVYSDFYELAEYMNEYGRGKFSPKEIAQNAFEYWSSAQFIEEFGRRGLVISVVLDLLKDDDSDEAREWSYRITEDQAVKFRIYKRKEKENGRPNSDE